MRGVCVGDSFRGAQNERPRADERSDCGMFLYHTLLCLQLMFLTSQICLAEDNTRGAIVGGSES